MNKRVVIEIDEDIYQGIKESDFAFARNAVRSFQATIADAIRKGIPLDAEVTQALEDVKTEIEKSIKESVEKTSFNGSVFRCGLHEAVEIIDRKIKEIKHE